MRRADYKGEIRNKRHITACTHFLTKAALINRDLESGLKKPLSFFFQLLCGGGGSRGAQTATRLTRPQGSQNEPPPDTKIAPIHAQEYSPTAQDIAAAAAAQGQRQKLKLAMSTFRCEISCYRR
jgi:hypothetical protein